MAAAEAAIASTAASRSAPRATWWLVAATWALAITTLVVTLHLEAVDEEPRRAETSDLISH
jgi:hypothetical protein